MKYLIIGLGNIGDEYTHTRHNIGFDILDVLAKENEQLFQLDRLAYYTVIKFKGRSLHLIKPTTYMNLSGKAFRYWQQELKVPLENCLVITDDVALPFGKIRIRNKGSDGGHNGLKSINDALQTQEYPRLRFGIGNVFPKGKQVDYVLGSWTATEKKELEKFILNASNAVKSFTTIGLPQTMTQFNQ